jgi:dihydroxy-acid dehydratase
VTGGPVRAPHRSFDHAVMARKGALLARERGIDVVRFGVFKKTPCIADSKPGGRYVAKDIVEVGGIPLPVTMQRDHGFLHGDRMTVTGRTENLKSVKCISNQDVARPANEPITVTGGAVGPKGNLVLQCAASGKAGKVSHADA